MSVEDKKDPQTVEVPTMNDNVTSTAKHQGGGLPRETGGKFLGRTGIYWLELVVAMLTIGIAASVISFSLFSLCSSLGDWTNGGSGVGGLWFAASTIVWTPVAYIFYMRVRGYELRHPNEVSSDAAQRVLVIIWQILSILTVIGFALAAVFSLLVALTQQNIGKTILDTTLPSFLSALLYAVMFTAFFRRPVISRKAFGAIFLAASLIVVLPTITVTIIQIRQQNESHPMTVQNQNTYTPSYNSNDYNNYNYNTYSN